MKEIRNTREIETAYPLMKQLRPSLSREDFVAKVLERQKSMHYRFFATYDDKQRLIGLCGIMPFHVLYREKCLYICILVIDSNLRGQGFG